MPVDDYWRGPHGFDLCSPELLLPSGQKMLSAAVPVFRVRPLESFRLRVG